MPLSATDILLAFDTLAADLAADGERAEMLVAGGAALVLLYHARDTTKDVDAYFLTPNASAVRRAAGRVADQLSLPEDWLNDSAKGYFEGLSEGETLYDSPPLRVRSVSTSQLLAMKLAAWRDAIDRSDAQLLLQRLSGSRSEIWKALELHVPTQYRDKASYAFEDLWESTHGTS
jgi:hypothetical protein